MLEAKEVYEALFAAQLAHGHVVQPLPAYASLDTRELMFFDHVVDRLNESANLTRACDDAKQEGYDEGYERGLDNGAQNMREALRSEHPTLFKLADEIDELRGRAQLAKTEGQVSKELQDARAQLAQVQQQIKEATCQLGEANVGVLVDAIEAAS